MVTIDGSSSVKTRINNYDFMERIMNKYDWRGSTGCFALYRANLSCTPRQISTVGQLRWENVRDEKEELGKSATDAASEDV